MSETERDLLTPTAENVLRHEVVVEAVRRMGPAIPARFGTVLPDASSLVAALDSRHAALCEDLERLGDKVEMGLTVLWDPPQEMSPDNPGGDDAPGARRTGAGYLRARYAQHRYAADLRDRAGKIAEDIDAVLRAHMLDHRCSILPTSRLVLRAAYLMHPSAVESLRDALGDLRRESFGCRFLLTGPWPPYSFVTVDADVRMAAGGRLDSVAREVTGAHTP